MQMFVGNGKKDYQKPATRRLFRMKFNKPGYFILFAQQNEDPFFRMPPNTLE